jgi:hypothetical protein
LLNPPKLRLVAKLAGTACSPKLTNLTILMLAT